MTRAEFSPEQVAAGEALFNRPWQFVRAVPGLEFLPATDRPEVAFAGRSNVGKSSLINALAKRSGLARTSNTPGRTQELNFYEAPGVMLYLVDMPGYGFAKAPKQKVDAWTALVKDYLRGRQTLARVFLLIDARHGVKVPDRAIMELMDEAAVSYQGVLTKTDKVKPPALAEIAAATQRELATHAAAHAVLLQTSSHTGAGLEYLRAAIAALAIAHGRPAGLRQSASRRSPS
jgi:GTP-binding protein